MKFAALFRAVFDAEDEVSAIIIADQIRVNGTVDLDEEEGDTLECTQVTSNANELNPDELMTLLRKVRNALIKTRMKDCFDAAKELDRLIYSLRFRDDPEFKLAGYSHGDFMDLAEAIIMRGETPDV